MSGRVAPRSFAKRFEDLEEHVRYMAVQRKGHSDSPTWIIGADTPLSSDLWIGPKFIGLDADGETPEWKQLVGFAGVLASGTATITWQLNGTDVGIALDLSPAPASADLDTPVDLAHADMLQPVLTDASSDAAGLSVCAFVVMAVR